MNDTVKAIIGGVLLGVAIFYSGGTVLGVGATGGSFLGVAGVAGAALAGGVIAGGLAITSALLKPKLPRLSDEFSREISLSGDPVAPRKVIYGEAWTAGVLRYRNTTGEDNKTLYMVILLAGHEIDSVPAVEADGDLLTLDGSGNVTSPAVYAGLMSVRYLLGTDTQAADAELIAANPSQWTSDHRLRGCAYTIVELLFDEEKLSHVPAFRFKVRGRKVYDPRLDSTNGGSGAHRLATPSTWAWSANAVLCANDYLRGVKTGTRPIAGLRIADTRFDWPNVIAEANVCDESVALAAGGNQARYTVNGVLDPRQSGGEILRHFEVAMAGDITFADGRWRFFAGAYRAPTLALEDKHFIGPLKHLVHKGEASRFDIAQGVYASTGDSGSVVDYPPVRLASAVVGEERVFALDLALVNNAPQAQRCAKLLLEREAAGKRIQCTTSLYGLRAVPGETINITHAAFGLSAQAMRVLDVQLSTVQAGDKSGLAVDLTLEAGPASLYAWDAEETAIAAAPALPQAQVPFNFTVSGTVEATNGLVWSRLPGSPQWSPATPTTNLVARFFRQSVEIATRTVQVALNTANGFLTAALLGSTGEATTHSVVSGGGSGVDPAIVQQKSAGSATTTVAATFDAPPTEGNTLVATLFARAANITSMPTGWLTAVDQPNAPDAERLRIAYKVAGAAESSTVSFGVDSTVGSQLTIYEVSGVDAGDPLDVVASTPSAGSGVSISSGTTASAEAGGIAFVATGIRFSVTSPAWSNGFSLLTHNITSGATLIDGFKVPTAAAAQESTLSWTTSREAIAAIAVFRSASGEASPGLTVKFTHTDSGQVVVESVFALQGDLLERNLVPWEHLVPGAAFASQTLNPDFLTVSSQNGNHVFEVDDGPFGRQEMLAKIAYSTVVTTGSFIGRVEWGTNGNISIDPTKPYRYRAFVKFTGNTTAFADRRLYMGPMNRSAGQEDVADLAGISGGAADANPYFVSAIDPDLDGIVEDRWYLVVGTVHQAGFAGARNLDTGIYDVATGTKLPVRDSQLSDYRYLAGNDTQGFRIGMVDQDATPAANSAHQMWIARMVWEPIDELTLPIADLLTGSVAQNANLNFGFVDNFEHGETERFWNTVVASSPEGVITHPVVAAVSGGRVLQVDDGRKWLSHRDLIPYYADVLYRVRCRVRRTAAGTGGTFYCGVTAFTEDRQPISTLGTVLYTSAHYHAANAASQAGWTLNAWQEFVGYFTGHSTVEADLLASPAINAPGALRTGAAYFAPMFIVNHSAADDTIQLDYVRVEAFVGARWVDVEGTAFVDDTIDNAGQLADDVTAGDGATYRPVARGPERGSARDGDVVTFDPAWDSVPNVSFGAGGLAYDNTLSANQTTDYEALNLSGSGFTAYLKIKELTGSTTLRTDSTVSTPSSPSGLDHSINKGQSAEAHDQKYKFQFDVTIDNINTGEPGLVRVGIYTNDGSGWVQRTTKNYAGDIGELQTVRSNQTITVTVSGLGLNDDFGINIESGDGSLNFDNVTYETAAAPVTHSATPAGASAVQYLVIGG